MMGHHRTLALLAAGASLAAGSLAAQEHRHTGKPEELGKVSFPVSCNAEAQQRFERGVAMLHSFWFGEAETTFQSVLEADPNCALAHWGIAMTMLGNPMARAAAGPALFQKGLAAVEQAQKLAASASHRERMYIDAAAAAYRDHETVDYLARMQRQESAFEALYKTHPEDMEGAIFYARTVVANAPPTDLTFARQKHAAGIMEPLFAKHPQHPGLAHYLIHAYDAPAIAQRGLDAARRYAGIAPAAPHALHMPSHIFTRVGAWDESIETNTRSAQAEPEPNAAVHPMDYMVYAYLQQGRDVEARQVVDKAVVLPDRFYGGLLGYNAMAMPARYALERSAWAEAAQLTVRPAPNRWVEAITRFARGVGAARTGNAAVAREEAAALAQIRAELQQKNDNYWATIVGAQALAVEAWLAHVDGKHADALRLGREAAELEETVEKHPVTPGPLLPARELYGDLLLVHKQPAEALAAYERTLEREPNRGRALFGAGRAAELAGQMEKARKYYSNLLKLMDRADPGRPEIAVAREFMGQKAAR